MPKNCRVHRISKEYFVGAIPRNVFAGGLAEEILTRKNQTAVFMVREPARLRNKHCLIF